jgi:hypothetical protein
MYTVASDGQRVMIQAPALRAAHELALAIKPIRACTGTYFAMGSKCLSSIARGSSSRAAQMADMESATCTNTTAARQL